MSGTLAEMLLQSTNPLTAGMLLALTAYVRQQFQDVRQRIRRLEGRYIAADGGERDGG